MLRTETLQLYRNVLRQLKKISNKSEKEEIQKWTREEFEKNRNLTDEVCSLNFYQYFLYNTTKTTIQPSKSK